MNILVSVKHGTSLTALNGGLVKFGSYNAQPYEMRDFPFFMILGVTGGLLGAFFNQINYEINVLRKFHLNAKWKKVVECGVLTLVTSFLLVSAPLITSSSCVKEVGTELHEAEFI